MEERYCINENYHEIVVWGDLIRIWSYTYSDGDVETVTIRESRQ